MGTNPTGPYITLKDVRDFFGMASVDFAKEWKQLTDADKEQIKAGIWNGSLTY